MQAKGLVIPTTFTAIDKFRPTVQGMVNSMEGFTSKAASLSAHSQRAFRRLAPAIGETQKQLLSMVGTAAMVGAVFATGRFSANAIMDYETAIQSLQAVTGVSNTQLEGFKKEIASVSSVTRKSSIDVAKSFETVGSMMSQYLENPKALRQITEAGIVLSKASRQELEPTLMSLTSVMNQFGLGAERAADTVNRLTAGEIVGSIRTAEASSYLQEFGAVAKNMNVTVGESTALIEALGIQMDKTKIGVGARNILTILSAAGGLDKKARRDLRTAGVDTKFLMDNTQSLSARLHELSKISKDPVKMVSVFGKENLTAGQVIFQQLGKYDEFAAKIMTTNKAQEQAATNSSTLRETIDRLTNSWINLITTSDKTATGVMKVTDTVTFLTNHLDTLVGVGFTVLKFYALWKGANILMTAATGVMSVAVGLQSGVLGVSSMALKGNTLALGAQKVALGASTLATGIATGNFAAFNAVVAANPIGLVITAVAALTGGIMLLNYRQSQLNAEYERTLNLRIENHVNRQKAEVDSLTQSWIKYGFSLRDATVKALQFKQVSSTEKLNTARSELANTQGRLLQATDEAWFPAFSSEVQRLRQEETMRKINLTNAMSDKLGVTNSLISARQSGAISSSDFFALNGGRSLNIGSPNIPTMPANAPFLSSGIDLNSIGTTDPSQMKAVITIQNNSENQVDVNSGSKSKSIMPQTSSTLTK